MARKPKRRLNKLTYMYFHPGLVTYHVVSSCSHAL